MEQLTHGIMRLLGFKELLDWRNPIGYYLDDGKFKLYFTHWVYAMKNKNNEECYMQYKIDSEYFCFVKTLDDLKSVYSEYMGKELDVSKLIPFEDVYNESEKIQLAGS